MPLRNRTSRLPINVAAAAALFILGAQVPAMSAPPSACNVPSVAAQALPAIVNVTAVKVLTTNGEDARLFVEGQPVRPGAPGTAAEPARPLIEAFVGSGAIINPAGSLSAISK